MTEVKWFQLITIASHPLTMHMHLTGNTRDTRFNATDQSLLPIDIRLMPSVNNTAGAMSVTIEEQRGGTTVAEGIKGFSSTYDVYLRPCSHELLEVINVTMVESVPDQINLSVNELNGTHFNNVECKATVVVDAFEDSMGEGDHYVNIRHVVKNKTNDEDIKLTDGSPLLAANLLVLVYDDDIAGVVITETNGITATAEIDKADKGNVTDALFYEDEYSVRLTKEPQGIVNITIHSKAVATDYNSSFTPEGRNLTKRTQVYINDTKMVSISHNAMHSSISYFCSHNFLCLCA